MAYTAFMSVVLIVSFALMFALVKFTENVIAPKEATSQASGDTRKGSDGRETIVTARQVGPT
jgi:hypothetical protein